MKVIKSYDEFLKIYLPKKYQEKMWRQEASEKKPPKLTRNERG